MAYAMEVAAHAMQVRGARHAGARARHGRCASHAMKVAAHDMQARGVRHKGCCVRHAGARRSHA
eukprot:105125-Chlamydomonas_euryale.AAC.1